MSKRFIPPHKKGFTLYSISNCKYCKMSCDKIKSDKKIINCDDYILTLRERDAFYKKMQKHTKIRYIHFPMIFKDAKFIGGYKELIS